jgi:hypothetical protein
MPARVGGVSDPVAAQVSAYNACDVEAFVACYTEDAVVADGEGTVTLQGRDAMRAAYGEVFAAHPDQRAEIVDRLRAGEWTVDHERVHRGGRTLDVLVAYRVRGGLIDRVSMLR